ncbi:MAG: hypothetical protein H6644_19150 [Caldilineaceae bacterium]|nr:hypothetical protein [Caldilineaceae bacterium]
MAERATPRAGGATLRGTPLTAPRRPRPIDAVSLPTALGASPPVRSIPPAATSLPVTRTPQERAGRDPSTSEPSRTAPEQASAPPSHETVEHAGDAYQARLTMDTAWALMLSPPATATSRPAIV